VTVPETVTVDSHLDPSAYHDALRADVRVGLTSTPKVLPPKYFYDEHGGELFDRITRLPEYYPTRTEGAILRQYAAQVAGACGADTLVELGSGTSEKTRLLLSALADAGSLRRFVPLDVDVSVLRDASVAISAEYPGVQVQAVVGDFERHLPLLPREGRRLIAFLGSTIGNLEPVGRAAFLRTVAATLAPGDSFLLGTDLVKDPARLVAAYDDAAGVTAAFNRNILSVINRELKADFDLDAFRHVARWDPVHEWIEMWLESTRPQVVTVADLDLVVPFAAGERMRTEISAKFRREGVEAELSAAGLSLSHWWSDPAGDFGVSLSVRRWTLPVPVPAPAPVPVPAPAPVPAPLERTSSPVPGQPILQIVIASTRPGRVGAPVAEWFTDRARAHGSFEVEVVDLAVVNLPMMDEPNHPRMRRYTHEHTKAWSATVERADAFVFVTPEYNYGFNAPLKNAIDYLHLEWQYKPVGFVSYGGVAAGTRAVQMLKQVVTTLRMTPVFEAVSIPFVAQFIDDEGVLQPNEVMDTAATQMLDELLRVEQALRPLRTPA
jgi:L-histidine N-alpha-methyltransferase